MAEVLEKGVVSWCFEEIARGERFEFGKKWERFLEGVRDEHVITAESSLKRRLEIDTLAGLSFLDIGSGSGLFSLSARRLGARAFVRLRSAISRLRRGVATTLFSRRRPMEAVTAWLRAKIPTSGLCAAADMLSAGLATSLCRHSLRRRKVHKRTRDRSDEKWVVMRRRICL